MASSLEELLAEEGFKGRRQNIGPSNSVALQSRSGPLHPPRRSVSQQGVKARTERTRSDVSRYDNEAGASTSDRVRLLRSGDNLVRKERLKSQSSKGLNDGVEARGGSDDVYRRKGLSVEKKRGSHTSEIVEIEEEEELNGKFKDIYSNEIYGSDSRRNSASVGKDMERSRGGTQKDINLEKKYTQEYNSSLLGRTSSSNNDRKNTTDNGGSSSRQSKVSRNYKSFGDKDSRRSESSTQSASEPALDQVAIQAMISIVTGHIKQYQHDEDFRNSLRVNCFSSLEMNELDEGYSTENKVISNLEQAIENVERAVDKGESSRDLKKASLLLSVITDLSSNDMKDGFTSGVPNFKLSACAHIYLSLIFKLQKKEKLSAMHLLQVFCISPNQARQSLLPELWDTLFLPHLSHLNKWFTDEATALGEDHSKSTRMRFLEKVYNEILDSSTFQFATYYKDWLTEDTDAPSLPLIHIPTLSVRGVEQSGSNANSSDWSSSSAAVFSPQPMVSRQLYKAVISSNKKSDSLGYEDKNCPDNYLRSSGSSAVEEKQEFITSSEMIKYADQDMKTNSFGHEDSSSLQQDGQVKISEDLWRLHEDEVCARKEGNSETEVRNFVEWNENSGSFQEVHTPCMTENELNLISIAKSVLKTKKTDALSQLNQKYAFRSSLLKEASGNNECFDKQSFFANAPQDFICPLTGQLLSDPVTLETGQTFERAAITNWLQKGNKTCPVTGKTLQCASVPLTNFILKRIVDKWKFDHIRRLKTLDSKDLHTLVEDEIEPKEKSSFSILERLLTGVSKEEKTRNAHHFISFGGLEVLIRRFDYGTPDEALNVASLLLYCIEADPGCRFQIAKDINKQKLLNLLHGKLVLARKYGVSLLTELFCLNRRKDIKLLFSSLPTETIIAASHTLLLYLQSTSPDQKPLTAVLLLHFDLLLEPQKYSIYREEAVDAISEALENSLTDESVRNMCCRALLVMGGHISVSGEVQTERSILKEAGYECSSAVKIIDHEEGAPQDKIILLDDEEQAREAWLKTVAMSLLGSGKLLFLELITKCLGSKFSDLVRACLTTVVWLSLALASLPDAGFQLTAFSTLISRLKETLENSEHVEDRILASISLLNFSKVPECRVLLMTIADEILVPLRGLTEITWTAQELYNVLSTNDSIFQERASEGL